MGFGINPDTGLGLGLISCCHEKKAITSCDQSDHHHHHQKRKKLVSLNMFPSLLTLGPPNKEGDQLSSPSAVSNSFSNSSVKKERDQFGCSEEAEVERRISDEDEEGSPRKKLRLTKQQSAILEDNFKEHSTLNPKQKQALAEQLNLRPRQVEVWFQNRRARTKLKQTEVDCEVLKKCCETLTEENKRLQKELQDLKSMKVAAPLYMHLPAATLSICPSCERIGGAAAGDGSSSTTLTVGPPKPHFFTTPFTHPSAAC